MSNKRPPSIPVYDPERSDITSDWLIERRARWMGNPFESIEEKPATELSRNRPNAHSIDRRRHRRSMLDSITTFMHGDSQLIVPGVSPNNDQELVWFRRYTASSQHWPELRSFQASIVNDDNEKLPTFTNLQPFIADNEPEKPPRPWSFQPSRASNEPTAPPSLHQLQPSTTAKEHEEPPSEGTLAWLHTLAGFFVVMDAQGLNMSYGVFQAYYQSVLIPQKAPATIAWIGSFQVFLLFAATVLVSPLIDKGQWRICSNGGSLLLVLSILITSWCTQWWQLLLVQGILTGLAMGLMYGSGVIILMSYFNESKRLGIATGIAAAGGPVGGMIYPTIAEQLVFRIGFPWTIRLIGLIVLLTLIPANIIVRQKETWKRKEKPKFDLTIFHDAAFLYLTAGLFFTMWGIYFGLYFLVTYAQTTLSLPPTPSITLLILLNALNLPGRLLPALLSDHSLGPLNTLLPLTLFTSFALFLWTAATTHASVVFVACLFGFATGGVQGLYNPVIWEFSAKKRGVGGGVVGVEDQGKAGARIAVVFLGMGVATLTGAPVGGALVGQMHGEYLGAQLFAGVSVLIGFGFLVAARWRREGWGPVRV
ncbi:hypothetical protein ACLMJK_000619 [Lecanora helva]